MKKKVIVNIILSLIIITGCNTNPVESNVLIKNVDKAIMTGIPVMKTFDRINVVENEEKTFTGKVIAERNAEEAKKEKEKSERKQRETEESISSSTYVQRLKEEAKKKTEKETSKFDDKIISKEGNTEISNKGDKKTKTPENNANTQIDNLPKPQVNSGNIVSGKRIVSGLQVSELNSKLSGYAEEIISLIQNSYESEVVLNFDWTFDEYKTVIQAIKNTYFSYCGTIFTSYTAFDGEVYKLQIGLSKEYFNKNREIEIYIQGAVNGTTGMSEKDAATVINNYVCSKTSYEINENTLEKAFLEGKGNCLSYALMYKEICNYIGIQCEIVKDAGENHAWNKVLLGGTWYYIDVCWNDSSNNTYMFSSILWDNHQDSAF